MRILWTSPHCRSDWLDRLGEESQGGQSVVMNKLPHALTRTNPDITIDIFTRLQNDDPHAANPIKLLDDNPRLRLIRLPCGSTDCYVPKEILYGQPIAEFAENILSFADRNGLHYDLLHGHYADGWETVNLLKGRLPHRPPTLLTTHSLGRRKRDDALKRGEGAIDELDRSYNFPVRIASEERSLSEADGILPLSTPEAEILNNYYDSVPPGDPRVIVIPNGIDQAEFPSPAPNAGLKIRNSLAINNSEFLMVVPSRVDPRKGQENILRALVEIRPILTIHPFHLLLLAWPESPTEYSIHLSQFISDQGLKDCVSIHPPVPHENMPDYFAAADGVALPSQEYFSIVMLEAMLLERPLIASIHGGSRDVIKDGVTGLLVDHND
ncbi:MAG: glycosyltransferase, partial [Thermodesulfobacteriota bacterium]